MEAKQMNIEQFLLQIFSGDMSKNMKHDFIFHFIIEEIRDVSNQDVFLDEVFEEENYAEYILTSNFTSVTRFTRTLRRFLDHTIFLKKIQ